VDLGLGGWSRRSGSAQVYWLLASGDRGFAADGRGHGGHGHADEGQAVPPRPASTWRCPALRIVLGGSWTTLSSWGGVQVLCDNGIKVLITSQPAIPPQGLPVPDGVRLVVHRCTSEFGMHLAADSVVQA
jgi:hypothetical protein